MPVAINVRQYIRVLSGSWKIWKNRLIIEFSSFGIFRIEHDKLPFALRPRRRFRKKSGGGFVFGRQRHRNAMALSTMVDSSIAMRWPCRPWQIAPLQCDGPVDHGRQLHCNAMALSTMVDNAIAMRWRYLPKISPPLRIFRGKQPFIGGYLRFLISFQVRISVKTQILTWE